MQSYDDIDPTAFLKVLIWGPPGIGKTSLMGTFPGLVVADCDRGIGVLKSRDYLRRFPKPDLVGFDVFDDERDPKTGLFMKATAYWEVIKFYNEVDDLDGVQTIGLDSLSSFQELAMNVGVELSGTHSRSKTLAKAKMDPRLGGIPILMPTQADFGSEMNAFQQFMDQAIAISKNLVFIAHEREETNSAGIAVRREPLLIGSAIRARVGRWFDEVWYMDADNKGNRVLRTQSTNKLKGLKSRALSLPDGIENPTYEKIIKAAKEAK